MMNNQLEDLENRRSEIEKEIQRELERSFPVGSDVMVFFSSRQTIPSAATVVRLIGRDCSVRVALKKIARGKNRETMRSFHFSKVLKAK